MFYEDRRAVAMRLSSSMAFVGVIGMASWGVCAEEQAGKFKGVADLVGEVEKAQNFSQDGKAVTVLFRNLDVSVGGTEGGPGVDSRVLTVALPVDAGAGEDVGMRVFVRGFVSTGEHSRAVLLVQTGGKTSVIDLEKGDGDAAKAVDRNHAARAKAARERAGWEMPGERKTAAGDRDFTGRIDATMTGGENHQVTFILLVERDDDAAEHGALLVVDSLDIELGAGTKSGG